jgi:hypothetical protein
MLVQCRPGGLSVATRAEVVLLASGGDERGDREVVDGSGLAAGGVDMGDGVGEQVVQGPLTAARAALKQKTGKKGSYGSGLYELMVGVVRLQVWR